MNLLQAAAIFTLWASHKFDTLDIATALNLPEPDVVKLLDAIRNRQHGPQLRVVK